MSILEFLQEYATEFPTGYFKVGRNRKELLREISVSKCVPEESLIEDFESNEPTLAHTFVRGSWSIHYNVYTDRVIFERILDTDTICRILELKQKNIRVELTERIKSLDPYHFENFVGNLFRGLPWVQSASITKRSHDGGIDLEGIYMDPQAKIKLPLFGQVKRWGNRVDFPEMTKFLGALSLKKKRHAIGLFVASNGFTKEASDAANDSDHKIILYNADELIEIMIDNSIGVQISKAEVVSPDEGFWSELIP